MEPECLHIPLIRDDESFPFWGVTFNLRVTREVALDSITKPKELVIVTKDGFVKTVCVASLKEEHDC